MKTRIGTLVAALALALIATACADTSTTDSAETVVAVTAEDGTALGSLGLSVNCGPAADTHLLRGVALLHNMTFTEAEAEFRAAAAAEPECAFAYWGTATSFVHVLWPDSVGAAQLEEGRALLAQAQAATIRDARDDAYIAALSAYYENAEERSEAERLQALLDGYAAANAADPSNRETQALYALSLISTAPRDPAFAQQIQAGEMLASVLEAIPDHPGAMHYTIHAYDQPELAERAVAAANSYGAVIPANSHALHMTSHIFTRLGDWPESIDYNRRAADVAVDHPVNGRVSHHYLHALDYLAYAYLQQGRDEMAQAVLDEMNGLAEMHDHAATTYAVAAVPVRLALEQRDWAAAAVLELQADGRSQVQNYPAFVAMQVFGRGLGAAHTGDSAAASAGVAELEQLRDAAREMPGAYDWAAQVEMQRLTLQSWVEFTAGQTEQALATAAAAAELESQHPKNPVTPGVVLPAREAYGDMLFAVERYADAIEQYRLNLDVNPNRYRSLLAAGDAARLMGDEEQAREFYSQLLEVAGEGERAELETVRESLGN
jgi:tetratricopeptide (TPR) repeat protein